MLQTIVVALAPVVTTLLLGVLAGWRVGPPFFVGPVAVQRLRPKLVAIAGQIVDIYPGAYHHFDWPDLPRRELPVRTADGRVRIEGTDPAARQEPFSRVPSFLARFLTN